nr:hypothetical protein [Tanacetum cinerariifolium]
MKAMQTQINNVKNELRYEMKNSIQALMSNQTNELKNMMASFFQMNTASTSGSGPLLSNTIANPKGELKAITTRSGIVLNGPFVPIPPLFINPDEDERVEETLTDQDLAEDPLHPNIPYPSRMHKQKQQEKDEVQVHKFWQMFKQLRINITLVDALILIPKYHKMLKALFSNKEKLLELANTPLNENCLAVILTKLPEKLGDPGKFLISCGFSLPEVISTQMTLELANQAICTAAEIARDVFVSVRKFTFPADFFIVDYESDPGFPLILGRPFLGTAHALIDIHEEETILYLFATNHQSANLTFSSHLDLTLMEVKDDIFDPEGGNVLIEKVINLHYTKELPPPPHNVNPLSGSTLSSSLNHFLEEFADELALITFTLGNDDLSFDIESDLKEIEYFLNHDPINEMDSILKDSVDEDNLADLNDNLVDTIPEMFTDEHALDYSSLPLYDEYDDDVFEVESSDFFPSPEYDSFLFEGFSKVDALPSTENKDKVFNPGILIQENLFEVITRVVLDKNVKKIAISHASLILEDFDLPPLYELPFLKEVLGELKCKALADLGASINLMPLSVWKKLGLPDLIPTQMTLELANRAICTPNRIARDVFIPVGKFTFPADFVVVDYESDPRVPLILGRPFLRTTRALIDVHGEEMILHDGDERLTLNMKHDTASYSNHPYRESVNLINIFNLLTSYSNHPYRESVNLINIFNLSSEDCHKDLVSNKQSGNPTFLLHKEIASPEVIHEIHDSKGCTFLSEEFPDTDSFNEFHPYFDDDPFSEDSDFKDSIDQSVLTHCDDLFVDLTPEIFTDEQPPDYSFLPRFDVYPDDFLEIESDATFDDDSFDFEGEKIKEAELLIDPLDLPCDILSEYDSFNS